MFGNRVFVRGEWVEEEEASTGVAEHMPVFGSRVAGEGERKNRQHLPPPMIKTGHEVGRGGNNSSTHDDEACSKKGVIADLGVLVDGGGEQ